MTREEILYLLPYLFSLALSLGITIYVWRHSRVRGAGAYGLLSTAQTLTIFGFMLELFSPGIRGKILWDKEQWICYSVMSLAIPFFAIRYTGLNFRHRYWIWSAATLVQVVMVAAILTDPWFHLVYQNPSLNRSFIFGELEYTFTPFVDAYSILSYLGILAAFVILGRRVVRPQRHYRAQVTAVIVGLFIPVLGTMLALLGLRLGPLRDATPITSALGNLIIAWSIFRYNWLGLVHIARDKVLENMDDLIFVLDDQDLIVDINPSALRLLGLTASQAKGKPVTEVLFEWPLVLEASDPPNPANHEVVLERENAFYHFDVKTTPLLDSRRHLQGRIIVARDITPYAALQSKLQELNQDLEHRVHDRTRELAEAYDTTLEGWARALELRDKETEGHSRNVTQLTLQLARRLGVPDESFIHIYRGALLHDIGKMGIPDEILHKAGDLTPEEEVIVRIHPETARRLLEPIPFLRQAMEIPYCHHEKWDGSGYPRGLQGEQIPLSARIFAIVDVWDALRSARPYRAALTPEKALEYITGQSGKHFDPGVVEAFLELYRQGQV